MLAFRAPGYDACPMEAGFDEPRVKHLLDLPHDARVVVVLVVGPRLSRSNRVRRDAELGFYAANATSPPGGANHGLPLSPRLYRT